MTFEQRTAEHRVHWTLGILRHFRALSTPEENLGLGVLSRPAPAPLTQTVETVEKVPFQKLTFEKWDGNAEKHLVFSVPHNTSVIF